jgi:alpha-galactosidase
MMSPLHRRAVSSSSACIAALFVISFETHSARADTTEITISMTAAPDAPRLLGAGTIGTVTGTPFLYTVAATGARPLSFDAAGLPAGLSIDGASGRITGSIATAGRYDVSFRVANANGSDSRQVTLVAGATVALTPPMGWNSYDSFDDSVRETEFTDQAQWLVDHLQPFGWEYVVVDYRWYDPTAPASDQNQAAINNNLVIDANGRLQPDPVRFPSATGNTGFASLAARVHAMGLKFGIHIMRGIPRRAVQANSPIAGSAFLAADAANTADTATWNSDMYGVRGDLPAGQAWYDSIVQQYAAWGVDFIKADDMIRNVAPILYHQSEVDALKRAIDKSGRSIVLSLSPGEMLPASAADLAANANLWRMSNDFWDRPADLDHIFALAGTWQAVAAPGHWPDADMLPLGHLGPRCPVDGANRDTRFTHNEQVTMMSFWSLLPSPLMLGANMPLMDAWTTALLTNEEALAVGQDALGRRARVVGAQGTEEIWSRTLSGARTAVGFFNHGAADAAMSVTWAALGISGAERVRDVWRRSDLATTTDSINVTVPFRGAILLVLTPDTPDAGADATTTVSDAAGEQSPVAVGDGGGAPSGSGAFDSSSDTGGVAVPNSDASISPPSESDAARIDGGSPTVITSRPDASPADSSAATKGCSCRVAGEGMQRNSWGAAGWLALSAISVVRYRRRARRDPE